MNRIRHAGRDGRVVWVTFEPDRDEVQGQSFTAKATSVETAKELLAHFRQIQREEEANAG